MTYYINRVRIELTHFKSTSNEWPKSCRVSGLIAKWYSSAAKSAARKLKRRIVINIFSDTAQGYWFLPSAEQLRLRRLLGDFDVSLAYISSGCIAK